MDPSGRAICDVFSRDIKTKKRGKRQVRGLNCFLIEDGIIDPSTETALKQYVCVLWQSLETRQFIKVLTLSVNIKTIHLRNVPVTGYSIIIKISKELPVPIITLNLQFGCGQL